MSLHQTVKGNQTSYLLDNYPWSELGACTMVDVGGSHGATSIAVAERFPALRCVVQDLASTIASRPTLTKLDGRLQYMAHDFFTEQPVKHADVYFFRWIFHDWSDERSTRILRCLIPALKPGAKILIQDSIVPEYGTTSTYNQRRYR